MIRRILLHRFVLVPALIGLAVLGWNIYVAQHAHGILTGTVVDAAGHPAAGAKVVLYVKDFVTQAQSAETRTDAAGRFRFDSNHSYQVQLQAEHGNLRSPRITVKLWFRAQDRALQQPLRLGAS